MHHIISFTADIISYALTVGKLNDILSIDHSRMVNLLSSEHSAGVLLVCIGRVASGIFTVLNVVLLLILAQLCNCKEVSSGEGYENNICRKLIIHQPLVISLRA
jgi:hypothetical protein